MAISSVSVFQGKSWETYILSKAFLLVDDKIDFISFYSSSASPFILEHQAQRIVMVNKPNMWSLCAFDVNNWIPSESNFISFGGPLLFFEAENNVHFQR